MSYTNMLYQPTIGLEIHTILKTERKMFCSCLNNFDEKGPNINVCPICLGHPGTLPVINFEAVEKVIKVGLALKGVIAKQTKFDRKNYFYPDLPKGYQISQYDEPLVKDASLQGIRITRIHIEEDAGRLLHEFPGESQKGEASFVDFNRAGVPLMELVTAPDFKSGEEALSFAKELQLILRYLEISNADMEKGEMRIEANVSLNKGTKVELKNINSFKAVKEAIDYELQRQNKLLERGESIIQETRGWDEVQKSTFSQRTKEEEQDYRYFPEPDLLVFYPHKIFDLENIKGELPELPAARKERFMREFSLTEEQAKLLIEDKKMADFFEEAASELAQYRKEHHDDKRIKKREELLFNYLTSDLRGLLNEAGTSFDELKISAENFAELIDLLVDGRILSRQAKNILEEMFISGADPSSIIEDKGWQLISSEQELIPVVRQVIDENPKAVEDYKKGKEASIQFMIGKAMSKLKGRGDPTVLKSLFEQHLK